MKKPKKFDEWFDTVYIVSEQGEYDAYNTWGDKVCDKCYEFLEKLLEIKRVGEERMGSFTIQELKDLYQALNMSIDWHSGLDTPNKLKRLHELQGKIDKMIKEEE